MTTAMEAFAITMSLIDELDEKSGSAESSETLDYRRRAPGIINALLGELYPWSDTYEVMQPGRRPICPPITDLSDALPLDDFLCRSVLPCALAARLLLDENPSVATFFERRYQELLAVHASRLPAVSESITDVYGGLRVSGDGVDTWL